VIGSLVLIAAPGNALRAEHGVRGLALSPIVWLTNYAQVLAESWPRFVAPVLVGFWFGAACALLRKISTINRRAIAHLSVLMCAAFLGSMLPFAAVPDFASSRTAFVPGVFIFAAAGAVTYLALSSRWLIYARGRPLGVVFATVLATAYIAFAGRE